MAIKRRRPINAFSWSFLDVMASGFGATLLVWLVMNHAHVPTQRNNTHQLLSEANLLEEDIKEGELGLVQQRQAIAAIDAKLTPLREQLKSTSATVQAEKPPELPKVPKADEQARVAALQTEISALEKKVESLRSQGGAFGGNNARAFAGNGDRQYLTGLRLGGEHIVIMLDTSTSMLDDNLVNVLRRRNMSESARKAAPKWSRALRTLEWLMAKLPLESKFQLVLFNETAQVAIAGSEGKWLPVIGSRDVDAAVNAAHAVIPHGGTSLLNAFGLVQKMQPEPDNIYLITDGLPTQGARVGTGMVSGHDREKMFAEAIALVPKKSTVNTILLPMDGDPNAAAAFWTLAIQSGGSMLTPSSDWP